MVSSIEALLDFIQTNPDNLENKIVSWIRNANGVFEKVELEEINGWLHNRRIAKKFSLFLKSYSEGFSNEIHDKATHCYIKGNEIEKYADRIYKARSAYLHKGEPMLISLDCLQDEQDDADKWDIDPCGGENNGPAMDVDRRRFLIGKKLPRVRWFERLANYCLKKFICCNQISK